MLNMTKTQRYAIWLKGFLDACDGMPTEKQVIIIKETLNSLFEHVAEEPTTVPIEHIKEKIQELETKIPSGFPSGFVSFEEPKQVLFRC
jgi:hypothetical protein